MLWGGKMNDVIILNKVFEGSWNDIDGNISHEIIDYVLTDNGEQYIYNTPWGHCPEDIYVKTRNSDKEKYKAKYLLLTSTTHTDKETGTHNFYINYYVELEEKLHNYSTSKNKDKHNKNRNEIINICKDRDIKYNGKYLHEIHKNDKSLLVTFKAKRIMKAKKPVEVALLYNFQRNKGYIKSDEFPNDYQIIIDRIEKEPDNWENFKLQSIKDLNYSINNNFSRKTFLDLILKTDSEECYTNILYSVLNQSSLINKFCKEFKKDNEILNEEKPFDVSREFGIVGGRMDVCADNGSQRIVIENKVFSGLNGVHKNESTQLSTYYKWATKDMKQKPLCFITVPDYRIDEVKQEILEKDEKMKDIYNIVGYSKVRQFIEENLKELNNNYDYDKYSIDFPAIFNQHSHKTKQEYYTNLFLRAILDSNETKDEKQP